MFLASAAISIDRRAFIDRTDNEGVTLTLPSPRPERPCLTIPPLSSNYSRLTFSYEAPIIEGLMSEWTPESLTSPDNGPALH